METKNLFTWHAAALPEVMKRLGTSSTGLSSNQILVRQKTWGKNSLPKGKAVSPWQMFFGQFTSPLVYILLVAAILTWWIKEYADMAIILVVVFVNALIGFFQEYRANKIFEKLKAIVRVEALVRRDGKIATVDSEELVPGDIIILKGGNKVPADAYLLTAQNLQANEALLTGESAPADKQPGLAEAKALVGDRHNMVFMGTVLETGEGQAVVTSIGAQTEIGQISILAQTTAEEVSPLQQRMKRLATFLTEVFLVISLAIFLIGILEGDPVIEMVKTTIAVAVAAIPEGLPAAISIILAVASKRILERKGLVMKLLAAETLGSTSVICTDKTGTLTYGQMRLEELQSQAPEQAVLALALANEAILEEKDGKILVRGEGTDKAKMEYVLAQGQNLDEILKTYPRQFLLQFDSVRKYLASVHGDGKNTRIFLSGAPEVIIQKSSLPAAAQEVELKKADNYAKRGFRMIALAEKTLTKNPGTMWDNQVVENVVNNLTYLGLAAIRDPIRPDVRQSLKMAKAAGIKVIMVTGDHILTAKAIGLELGFATSGEAVILGEELQKLSDKALTKRLATIEIVARVNPEHKMRIINLWQKMGAVVAMTGDGVNDAPALKTADIGVAVGSGTDVSKEASDLILLDDSFTTIAAAVEEGRTGFANIRKATVVVMSNAFTEIMLITGSLIFSTPFPITAVQILWVNLVEDGLPVLSLAFEKTEQGTMQRRPLPLSEPILDREIKFLIFAVGIFTDLLLFGIFMYLLKFSAWDFIKIQSFIFVCTATPTLLNIFAFKSMRAPLWKIPLLNNRLLIYSVLLGFLLMLAAIYLPFFNRFLKTVPLSPALIAATLGYAGLKLSLVELTKWHFRRHENY